MQQEIRFATFNVCNLAPPGARLYDNLEPSTPEEYEAKIAWTARQIDMLNADVIGFQEVFSQAALAEALSRTRRYREVLHVGFDPDPHADKLTPSVAMVSRLPLAATPEPIPFFPAGITMPPGNRDPDRFTRPPLHAAIQLGPDLIADVLVVHLKSRRPDFRADDSGEDPQLFALASLRSLIRRGTEAAALRVILSQMRRERGRPCVVLGDFNDVADAVTTGIVLGIGAPIDDRLYDACSLQRRQDRLRHVGFSNVHDGQYTTIDHILVTEEFTGAQPGALAEIVDVVYLNDHLDLGLPEASDHGQVLARLRLLGPAGEALGDG